MSKRAQEMPKTMTKRRHKVKMANTGTNSTQNGKQAPKFIVGGGAKGVPELGMGCSWNSGRCYPSKVFKKITL